MWWLAWKETWKLTIQRTDVRVMVDEVLTHWSVSNCNAFQKKCLYYSKRLSWCTQCEVIVWPMLDMDSNKTLKIVHSDLKTFELHIITYHTPVSVNKVEVQLILQDWMHVFVHSSLMFQKFILKLFPLCYWNGFISTARCYTSILICIIL